MQKGISPLVAAVMLIAATMSIAGILAYWASTFVKPALPEVNSSQSTCQYADFQIDHCSYSNATQTISFVLYNSRTLTLSGLTATVFDVDNGVSGYAGNATLSGTIVPGQFAGFSLTNIPSNFTKMVISSSVCPSILHDTTCTRS